MNCQYCDLTTAGQHQVGCPHWSPGFITSVTGGPVPVPAREHTLPEKGPLAVFAESIGDRERMEWEPHLRREQAINSELRAEVARLKTCLDNSRAAYGLAMRRLDASTIRNGALTADNARLREALENAELPHAGDCLIGQMVEDALGHKDMADCTCGLAVLLAAEHEEEVMPNATAAEHVYQSERRRDAVTGGVASESRAESKEGKA